MGVITITMGSKLEPQVGLVPAQGQEMYVRVKRSVGRKVGRGPGSEVEGECKEERNKPDNPQVNTENVIETVKGLSLKVEKDHEVEMKRSDHPL